MTDDQDQQQRAAFEAWAGREEMSVERYSPGGYCSAITCDAWRLWQAATLAAAPRWIACAERLPEGGVTVFARFSNDETLDARLDPEEGWCDDWGELETPTHWMPIPDFNDGGDPAE